LTTTIDRPGRKIDSVSFSPEVTGEDFSNCRIEWARGKKVVFIKCNFSSSLIKLCYFHRAVFRDCDFTGCIITESNFRGAVFENCEFRYVTVRSTSIEVKQMLKNLPYWENSRRELLRGLRKNAESIGDVEDVRMCLKAEMDASAEHWRSAFRQVTPYFAMHYPGLKGRLTSLLKLIGIKAGKWFWGYGESPLRLLFSLFFWIVLACFFVSWPKLPSAFIDSFQQISSVMIGVQQGDALSMSGWQKLVIVASRYVFLGLFATVFVRRFARR
jgi:hypothetical protein